ncbi:MAG TPA: D-glycero-beta-D-manno-heptose 1-phosphate adenylyltransferase [Bacteroidales bacterium]|nr:D-glycero-beta-D-manno-heptose 1-phosphate adenylyltransferase [Bacteroidales bacterium]
MMQSKYDVIKSKIIQTDQYGRLLQLVNYWRFQEKKVVFTNGCFDLVHLGHIDYLSKAADLGNVLVVGLNTDASVSRLKGPNRPINNQNARAMLLASMFFVNHVVLFDEGTPYELIKLVNPSVLVKGSDYKPEEIVGYDLVMAGKGKVVSIDFLEGYSTSGIIERIKTN